jgi:uncharacterized protein (TIGR03067 family)
LIWANTLGPRETFPMRWSLGILFLAVVGPASPIHADDPAAGKAERLEGRWRVAALESDGRKATEAEVKAMKDGGWTFKDSQVSFDDPNAPGKSTFKLDPSKSPKQIDLIGVDGPQKGKTMEGIYKREGKRLTICVRDLAAAAKGRPTEFVTKAESGLGLIVLEQAD